MYKKLLIISALIFAGLQAEEAPVDFNNPLQIMVCGQSVSVDACFPVVHKISVSLPDDKNLLELTIKGMAIEVEAGRAPKSDLLHAQDKCSALVSKCGFGGNNVTLSGKNHSFSDSSVMAKNNLFLECLEVAKFNSSLVTAGGSAVICCKKLESTSLFFKHSEDKFLTLSSILKGASWLVGIDIVPRDDMASSPFSLYLEGALDFAQPDCKDFLIVGAKKLIFYFCNPTAQAGLVNASVESEKLQEPKSVDKEIVIDEVSSKKGKLAAAWSFVRSTISSWWRGS